MKRQVFIVTTWGSHLVARKKVKRFGLKRNIKMKFTIMGGPMTEKAKSWWNRMLLMIMAALGIYTGQHTEEIKDYASGAKRHVVLIEPGKVVALSALGVEPIETMVGGGYVVKISKKKADELRAQTFEVYEDKHYKLPAIQVAKECPPCDNIPGQPTPPPTDPSNPVKDEIPWGTDRVEALRAQALMKGNKVLVGVLDTGADPSHPDLASVIRNGKSFVPGEASFVDTQGHGTHVSGTIGANRDDKGIIGVAAGAVQIMPAKVLDRNGSGYSSWIYNGGMWLIEQNVVAINVSLGSPHEGGSDPLIAKFVRAAAAKNIPVIIAAGNDGGRTGHPAMLAPESDYIFSVAAMDRNNQIASFSNRGPETSLIAPGVDIKSTIPGGRYATWSGTSMAAPHVTAVAAMCKLVKCPGLFAVKLPGLSSEEQGEGLINAYLTVKE